MREELLKLSNERYIPPYNLALAYNGVDERDKTLAWLLSACCSGAMASHAPEKKWTLTIKYMIFMKQSPTAAHPIQ